MRVVKALALTLVILYAVLLGGAYAVMSQPPLRFGHIMSHVPSPVMMALPFETMWNRARVGTVRVGDRAPDFSLLTTDRTARVSLSSDRGRPVVLVFGSYT